MENTLPEMSLKAAGITPVAFQGSVFTPQLADINILNNSLTKMEAREEKAAEKKSVVDKTLADVEQKINVKELPWFNEKKAKVQQLIQNEIDNGDYGAAIKVATNLADEVLLGADTQNRIKAQNTYLQTDAEQKKRLEKGEIDQSTYNWWKYNNPYQYTDEYDENGNIVGGEYKPNFIPKNTINWSNVVYNAFRRITADKNTTNKQWNKTTATSENGIRTSDVTGGLRGSSYERVTAADIQKVTNMLLQDTDTAQQMFQSYDVAFHDFKQIQKAYNDALNNPDISPFEKKKITDKYNDRRSFLYRNDSPIPLQDFINKQVNVYANALSYNWNTSNKGDTTVDKDINTGQTTTPPTGTLGASPSQYTQSSWRSTEEGANLRDDTGSTGYTIAMYNTVSGMAKQMATAAKK